MLHVNLLKFCFILSRGNEFRTNYSQLGMFSAFFPNAPMIALTATANLMIRVQIKHSLNMKSSVEIIGNPDRRNIFYSKELRDGEELVSYEMILKPIAMKLIKLKVNYPPTIIYLPLRWCGFAYKLFDRVFGKAQYYPDETDSIPEKRLFAQYNAPQTSAMKEMILVQISSESSIIRIVFATVAIRIGLIYLTSGKLLILVHHHLFSSISKKQGGLAVMVFHPIKALLYYNNRDIAKNRHFGEDMRTYCKLEHQCLRKFLIEYLQCEKLCTNIGHGCCSFCSMHCKCLNCELECL